MLDDSVWRAMRSMHALRASRSDRSDQAQSPWRTQCTMQAVHDHEMAHAVHASLRDARSACNLGDQSDRGDRQNFFENREVG